MSSDALGASSTPRVYATWSPLKLIENRPEGKPVAGTFGAGNITMANDVLQGNVVTVFQSPTELNERGDLLRAWCGRPLFPGWIIFAAEVTHN
jgi:hypothetical protein